MTGLTLRRASERDRPSGGAPAVVEPENERQNQVQPAAQGHASRRPDTPRTETRTDDDGTRPGGALREKPVGKAGRKNGARRCAYCRALARLPEKKTGDEPGRKGTHNSKIEGAATHVKRNRANKETQQRTRHNGCGGVVASG
jgi:hypothetical protein